MLNKTKAIVLNNLKYGETSLIVTLYTEKYGRIACMVNHARTKKAKFPVTCFQPLSLLETDIYFKNNREIQRFKEVNFHFYYTSIPFNIAKSTVALFLAEVLYLSLREEEANPPVFSFIINSLQLFDLIPGSSPLFHPWFLIQLSRYLGFLPSTNIFEPGDISWSSDTSAFKQLTPRSLNALKMLSESKERPSALTLTHDERNELLEALLRYYSAHIDGFSRIRSFKILREVFE